MSDQNRKMFFDIEKKMLPNINHLKQICSIPIAKIETEITYTLRNSNAFSKNTGNDKGNDNNRTNKTATFSCPLERSESMQRLYYYSCIKCNGCCVCFT